MAQTRPSRRNYRNGTPDCGRWTMLNSLGPSLYAMRLENGVIKIGHTADLAERERTVRRQAGGPVELLAFQPGTYADEQALHGRLHAHRHHGREWYHPTPEVIAEVDAMRAALGMAPLGS